VLYQSFTDLVGEAGANRQHMMRGILPREPHEAFTFVAYHPDRGLQVSDQIRQCLEQVGFLQVRSVGHLKPLTERGLPPG
jgi:hypothetical protein